MITRLVIGAFVFSLILGCRVGEAGNGTTHREHDHAHELLQGSSERSASDKEEKRIIVYAWSDAGGQFEHIIPSIIVDPRSKSPRDLAGDIARRIRIKRPERIGLRLWKEFDPAHRDPFDLADPEALLASRGFGGGLRSYWSAFARSLASRGVTPDFVIQDMEEGISFWHIPEDRRELFFRMITSDRSEVARLIPEAVRRVDPSRITDMRDPVGQRALVAYNHFAASFRAGFLRRHIYEPFREVYGDRFKFSNYRDLRTGFEVETWTGRPLASASVSDISSPVTYLVRRGSPRYRKAEKAESWNSLIDRLNACRSAMAHGETVPWIAPPGFGVRGRNSWCQPERLDSEIEVWSVLLHHLAGMGIDTFLLWNPGPEHNPNAAETNKYMNAWFGSNGARAEPLRDLRKIPLDADRIETGGVVTTYEEFREITRSSGD